MQAPFETVIERFAQRQRALQIAHSDDLKQIEILLQDWMSFQPPEPLLPLDVSAEEISYTSSIARAYHEINQLWGLKL